MTISNYWAKVNFIEKMIQMSALTLNNNEEKTIDGLTNIFKASTAKFLDYPTDMTVKVAKLNNEIRLIIQIEGNEEIWNISEFAETIANTYQYTELSA